MSDNTPIRLSIPRQERTAFSLFPLTADAASAWAGNLPVTSTLRLVQQLLEAIEELNHVVVPAERRYGIIEAMRPSLQVAKSSLSRRFINQPLVLPAEPQHIADLAERLFSATGTAYTLVAVHATRDRESIQDINPARLVCEALQRALCFTGCRIFQRYQLYQALEPGVWQTLHQLYAFAERQQLTRAQVSGVKVAETTVSATYLKPLLLACCKPSQLRQSDLAAVFRCLEEWSGLASISAAGEGLFSVDLSSDRGPNYAGAALNREAPQLRIIATGQVVARLRQLQEESDYNTQQGVVFDNDTRLYPHVIQHMIDALSSISMRNFNRSPFEQQLHVALGLSNAHFHCAGKRNFDQVMRGADYQPDARERKSGNPFMEHRITDQWERNDPDGIHRSENRPGASVDSGSQSIEPDAETRKALLGEATNDPALSAERFPLFAVQAVNVGPGGYCLRWATGLPGDARSGDILCVREHDNSEWAIAAIRWTTQLEDRDTMVGIELLSPRATAYGAKIRRQQGAPSGAIRVLMLPEIALVAQPRTLITPRTGFHERLKITLLRNGLRHDIQLQKQVATTSTFSQFEFRDIPAENKTDPAQDYNLPSAAFESIWNKI